MNLILDRTYQQGTTDKRVATEMSRVYISWVYFLIINLMFPGKSTHAIQKDFCERQHQVNLFY